MFPIRSLTPQQAKAFALAAGFMLIDNAQNYAIS
jgi:hypothetical protein